MTYLKKQNLLERAEQVVGRVKLAEGLKITEKQLDAWIAGREGMPDSKLISLSALLVQFSETRK